MAGSAGDIKFLEASLNLMVTDTRRGVKPHAINNFNTVSKSAKGNTLRSEYIDKIKSIFGDDT